VRLKVTANEPRVFLIVGRLLRVHIGSRPHPNNLYGCSDGHKHRTGDGTSANLLRGRVSSSKDGQVKTNEDTDPGEQHSAYENQLHSHRPALIWLLSPIHR